MHKRALLLASLLFVVGSSLAFAADSVTLAPPTGPGPTAAPALAGAAVLMKHHNTLGNILADGDGRTLYLYTKDERNKSNCSGGCLKAWPALLTVEAPQSGPGVAGNRLATITRDDGTKQVAYNGWPLYYFASDATPGETKGQDVGGVWFVVHAAGGGPVQTNAPINIAKNATFGNILVEASGRVLYLYSRDELNKSNCSGGCLLAWPALLTVGDPKIGEGIDAKLVGSISREDGARQLTYNGWPLYYYAPDEKPGDTKGQNVGGVWFVLSAAGKAVGLAPAALPNTGDELTGSAMGLGAVVGMLLLAGGLWMRRRVTV